MEQSFPGQGVGSEPKEPREFPRAPLPLCSSTKKNLFSKTGKQAKIKGLKLKCNQDSHTRQGCVSFQPHLRKEAPCRSDRCPTRAAGRARCCHFHGETGWGFRAHTAWTGTLAWHPATERSSQHPSMGILRCQPSLQKASQK